MRKVKIEAYYSPEQACLGTDWCFIDASNGRVMTEVQSFGMSVSIDDVMGKARLTCIAYPIETAEVKEYTEEVEIVSIDMKPRSA